MTSQLQQEGCFTLALPHDPCVVHVQHALTDVRGASLTTAQCAQCIDKALHAHRFEAWIPVAGAIVTLIVFVALPTYFYTHKYPHLNNCGADVSRYY